MDLVILPPGLREQALGPTWSAETRRFCYYLPFLLMLKGQQPSSTQPATGPPYVPSEGSAAIEVPTSMAVFSYTAV